MEQNSTPIGYFNLKNAGDTAVVRLLHSSVSTIEKSMTHWMDVSGKRKCFKCAGDGCPLCANGIQSDERIYIHLFDYTDNKEKIWSRTDKIIEKLRSVENDWGNLSDCVVRITRESGQFPSYTVSVLNANLYAPVNKELVDKKIAYRCYITRSVSELTQFLSTGVLPAHETKPFIPKEQYLAQKNAGSAQVYNRTALQQQKQSPSVQNNSFVNQNATYGNSANQFNASHSQTTNDDVFIDPFLQPINRV